MPDGSQMMVETLHGIPLYDADLEASEGIPARVTQLKEAVADADGLLLATPEYNNSIPGVFKTGSTGSPARHQTSRMFSAASRLPSSARRPAVLARS